MPMSPAALAHDENLVNPKIALKEIYASPDWNCRGYIQAQEVTELAADIAAKGLILPVVVRPLWASETPLAARGFKYSLISGFRRFMCYRINGAEKIPAQIENFSNDFDARDANARENLQRKDLTLWQECQTIKHYWAAEWSRDDIARRVGKSPGWVQVRTMLLEMPTEIQTFANEGYLTQQDVRDLGKYTGKERLMMANRIRDLRKTGSSKQIKYVKVKPDKPSTRKARTAFEVQEIMERIRQYCCKIDRTKSVELKYLITDQGNMITHRVLSWSTGAITTLDLHMALRDFFLLFNVTYEMPKMEHDEPFPMRA